MNNAARSGHSDGRRNLFGFKIEVEKKRYPSNPDSNKNERFIGQEEILPGVGMTKINNLPKPFLLRTLIINHYSLIINSVSLRPD